ncbi:MAG: CotH kinase family protein [Chitinophagaceae bacterium]|nr:CotH kinase family protein [Chitinophagaceae bacterium]
MKRIFLFILVFISFTKISIAGNGDSIFNMNYIHNLYITFPYPSFYDSLIYSYNNDVYLKVDINFNGEIYTQVGVKAKGNSSFNNPSQKKSFKLDFNEFVAGQDIHGLKKLNFNNGFKDPSFMREKLSNDFMISHGIPAPRVTYCNVYMNNQLWGLYNVVEEVDDEFCKAWFNSNDGNLFKGDPHGDLRWKGSTTQSLYESDYELKNNSTTNDWSDLIGLIDILKNTPIASLYPTLDSKLNTSGFVKYWAASNLFSSLDSYIGSGHNYFLYHDTVTNLFQWISWDNNEAFGSFKNGLSTAQLKDLDMYYLSNPATNRPLCNNMLANSTYKYMYNDAYCALKQDFTNDYFDPKIDSLRTVLQASVYADPKKFYSNAAYDSSFNYDITSSGPGGLTIFGLKPFIASRQASATTQIATQGITCWPLEVPEESQPRAKVYPNPGINLVEVDYPDDIHSYELIDITGKKLTQASGLLKKHLQLDLSAYPSGIYLLRINQVQVYKIVH